MMTPRSYLYSNKGRHPRQKKCHHPSSSPSDPRQQQPSITTFTSSSPFITSPPPPSPNFTSPSPSPYSTSPTYHHYEHASRHAAYTTSTKTASPELGSSSSSNISADLDRNKYAQDPIISIKPVPASDPGSTFTSQSETMAKRKSPAEATTSLAPTSPPRTTTSVSMSTRPTTPTGPRQIPSSKLKHASSDHNIGKTHASRQHAQKRTRRPKDVHVPDAIPPSMAALLAVTDIPRPRRGGARGKPASKDKSLMLNAVLERQQVSEKELSLTLGGKSPLDLLLSPPDELEEDGYMSTMSISDSGMGSASSGRTVSMDSMPSLADSFATEGNSSIETPCSVGMCSVRRRQSRKPRRSLEPVSSPSCLTDDHPLSASEEDLDSLEFNAPSEVSDRDDTRSEVSLSLSDMAFPLRPLKSAFKSNLTASLRALRSAAKSISSMNLTSVPPEDFLTRSILTMDPKVPYTDERRPPVLEEEPSAALRRYLNPTSNALMETHPSTLSPTRTFTASIQMQTYKVQRSRSEPTPPTRSPYPATSPQSAQATPYQPPTQQSRNSTSFGATPVAMRQRETRENSDFIRIAVMEMAMRKHGKLDDQKPGRARWTLPARRAPARPYMIGADGVPARWIPVTE